MNINNTKRKLKEGNNVLGTFVTMNSLEVAKVLSDIGYDYLMLDFEHGGMSIETLGQQILAIKTSNTSPLVRIASNTEENVKKALDAGAYGIMLPMVASKEDVEKFIEYSQFPPYGKRGCGAVRANNFFTQAKDYFKFCESEILRIIQIEQKEAVENIEEIVSVEGIDVVFIGPYDLSFSLGTPGDINSDVVNKAIDRVADVCKKNNVDLGIMTDKTLVDKYLEKGFKFILMGLDSMHLVNSANSDINKFKEICLK